MEITSIESFIEYFERIRQRTNRLIAVIPPEHLDFAYMPAKFTIGDEIRHIAAIERFMYAETISGRKSAYQGCGKELADGYQNVLEFFDRLHQESLEIFSSLSVEDLKRKCTTHGNAEIAVWKWLRAMVEHEIHHRGRIYVYLSILGIKTPPLFGLTSEEVESRSVFNEFS